MDAICPRCTVPLLPVTPGVAACPEGHGRAYTLEAARARLPREAHAGIGLVLRRAPIGHAGCPVCREPMARGEAQVGTRRGLFGRRGVMATLDACPACEVLWLDAAAAGALGA